MDNAITKGELFRPRRMRHAGKSYMTAVEREAYCNDRLVAWTGHRNAPRQVWYQRALEIPREFYDRVNMEIQ